MVEIKILKNKKIFNFLLSISKIKADISIKIGIKTNHGAHDFRYI